MHHANLIIGSEEWGMNQIPLLDRTESADVIFKVSDRLSIEAVRSLIYEANLRPVEREYRSFVIQTSQILGDAQNALLKLFEEPNAHTVFYLILPREDILIPTLRSRMMLLAAEGRVYSGSVLDAFRALSYANRLSEIGERLKNEDHVWVRDMVNALSSYAHTAKEPNLIRDVLMLESCVYTNGSSKKMLLEQVALTLS